MADPIEVGEDDVDMGEREIPDYPEPTHEQQEQLLEIISRLSPQCQEQVERVSSERIPMDDMCINELKEIMNIAGVGTGTPVELGPDPTPYIFAFLAIFFVAVGYKIYNISNALKQLPQKPKKVLSKRKQQKQRMKEQARNKG